MMDPRLGCLPEAARGPRCSLGGYRHPPAEGLRGGLGALWDAAGAPCRGGVLNGVALYPLLRMQDSSTCACVSVCIDM